MTRSLMLFVAAATLAAVGCATAKPSDPQMTEKAAAKLAKFDVTGETKRCIGSNLIRSIDALDDWHFLVTTTSGDYYLNKVSGRCSGAGSLSNRLQYSTTTGQLCRNEFIEVVENSSGFSLGSCSLGDFEALEKKPAE